MGSARSSIARAFEAPAKAGLRASRSRSRLADRVAHSGDAGPTVDPTVGGHGFIGAAPSRRSSSSAQLRLSVPDSWSTFQDWAVIKEAGTGVAFGSVGNIYTDRCHWSGALLDPRVGPSVDDLAIAVAESWGSDASAPMEVMLDGFAGKQMVLTVPTDVDFADCFLGRFQWGVNDESGERYYQGPGQIGQWWILESTAPGS